MSALSTGQARVRARAQMGRAHGLESVRARTPHTPRVCVNALAGVSKRARRDSRARTRAAEGVEWFLPGGGSQETPAGTAAKGDRLSFGCPVRSRRSRARDVGPCRARPRIARPQHREALSPHGRTSPNVGEVGPERPLRGPDRPRFPYLHGGSP